MKEFFIAPPRSCSWFNLCQVDHAYDEFKATKISAADLSKYDTILLGYPIWGGKAPNILCTFLESMDLSGKTIVPFCTSNSSQFGSSDKELKKITGDSVTWKKGTRIPKGATAEEIIEKAQEILNPEE